MLVDPYLYQQGGDIDGDYKFKKGTKVSMEDDADIELQGEEARLQMQTDVNNYLCFREGETYINLDLEVGGSIHATALDVDRIDLGEDILVKGDVTVQGNTDVQTLTAHEDANFEKLTADEIITDDLTVQDNFTFNNHLNLILNMIMK